MGICFGGQPESSDSFPEGVPHQPRPLSGSKVTRAVHMAPHLRSDHMIGKPTIARPLFEDDDIMTHMPKVPEDIIQ